jgi:outer membrane lipoprotein-sorting protein
VFFRAISISILLYRSPEVAPGITGTPSMKMNSRILSQRMAARITVCIFMVLFPVFLSVGESEDKLESVLKRLEKASRSFQSFVADVTTTKYTAILERFDQPENGKFFFKRAENGTALIRWEIVNPGLRILTIQNDEALLYRPKIRSAQKYKLGKNKDKAEYLALGIGQSPTDLKRTFNIAYRGSENVYGAACSILVLKPKDPKSAAMFSSITVWIKDSTGISTRMKLQEPYEDYLLVNFSNEQLNNKIDNSKFRQELPANVEMLQIY